jgi:hypothetical protein
MHGIRRVDCMTLFHKKVVRASMAVRAFYNDARGRRRPPNVSAGYPGNQSSLTQAWQPRIFPQ